MPIATNPKTGEVVFLDQDGAWKPAKTAVNPETKEAVAFDGQGWKPLPVSKGVIDYVDDAVRSVASGITLGYADEFAAFMESMTTNKTYEDALKEQAKRDKSISPDIAIPGEIVGAVGGTVAAAPVAIAAAPAKVKQFIQNLPRVLQFLGLGAIEGGIAGAGHAEPGERLESAAKGAAIGAPVGVAALGATRAVEAGVRGVKSALMPQTGAATDLARAMTRDQDTPQALMQRLTAAEAERPGQVTLADVGGENVKGLVERIAQTPGAGRTQVIPALTTRQTEQATRISEDLKSLTGTNKSAMQAVDEAMELRANEAKPLYDAAMQFDAKQSPEIVNAFLKAVSAGWGKSIAHSDAFKQTLATEYGITNAADAIRRIPLMALVDTWKKAVDDVAGDALRSGNNNKARILEKMRDELIDVVDQHNPAYATARAAWAGKSKYLEAVEEGRNIIGRNVSAEEVAKNFAKKTDAEKEAYRIGTVSSVISRMGSDPAKLADMTKYLRSPEMLKKISAIMPTPEAAASWLKRMQFEVGSSELAARALGNSATVRRQAELADAQGIVGDLVMDAIVHGSTSGLSLFNRALQAGPRWLRDTLRSRTDAALADLLVNPQRAQDLPQVVQRAGARASAGSGMVAPAAVTAGAVNALQ